MKKINLLWALSMALFVFSCNEEDLLSPELTDVESKAYITTCDISGNSCGNPGSTSVLTYTSDFTPNDVNWSIQSGNISIINGQGTSMVTVQFGSNFNGGSVYAVGSGNGGIICSDSYPISKCPQPPSCNLTFGGELDNGQLMAFSPTPNNVLNNVLYRTDMWVSPSDASVTWTRIGPFGSSIAWSQSGKNLSFRFNDNSPNTTGGRATFRMTVSKSGCESVSRDFIFCHGDCSSGGGPEI